MATTLALLLVEEPEAHLHPQLQDRVMDLLKTALKGTRPTASAACRSSATTHSPTLVSSADILNHDAGAQSAKPTRCAPGHTKLQKTDFSFLQRFIDLTKANLFFARGVMDGRRPLPRLSCCCRWHRPAGALQARRLHRQRGTYRPVSLRASCSARCWTAIPCASRLSD